MKMIIILILLLLKVENQTFLTDGCISLEFSPENGFGFSNSEMQINISISEKSKIKTGAGFSNLSDYSNEDSKFLTDLLLGIPVFYADHSIFLLDLNSSEIIVPNEATNYETNNKIGVKFINLEMNHLFELFTSLRIFDSETTNQHHSIEWTGFIQYSTLPLLLDTITQPNPPNFCSKFTELNFTIQDKKPKQNYGLQEIIVNYINNEEWILEITADIDISDSFPTEKKIIIKKFEVNSEEYSLENEISMNFLINGEAEIIVPIMKAGEHENLIEYTEGNSPEGVETIQQEITEKRAEMIFDLHKEGSFNLEIFDMNLGYFRPLEIGDPESVEEVYQSGTYWLGKFTNKTDNDSIIYLSFSIGEYRSNKSWFYYKEPEVHGVNCPMGSLRNMMCPFCQNGQLHMLGVDLTTIFSSYNFSLQDRIVDQNKSIDFSIGSQFNSSFNLSSEPFYQDQYVNISVLNFDEIVPNFKSIQNDRLFVENYDLYDSMDRNNLSRWRFVNQQYFNDSLDSIGVLMDVFINQNDFCMQEQGSGLKFSASYFVHNNFDNITVKKIENFNTNLWNNSVVQRIRFGSDNQSLVFQPENVGSMSLLFGVNSSFLSFSLPQISNFSKENFSLITDSNNFKKATIEFQIENNGEVSGMIVGYLSCNNSDLVINPDNPKQMNISSNSKSSLVFEVDYESSLDEDAKIECELDISQNSLPLWNITYENETVNGLIIPIYNGCLFQRADPYFPVDGISGIQVDNFDTNQESNENSFQLKFLVKINNSPVSVVFSLDCFINSSLILHETNSINFSQSEIQKYVDWIVVFESSFEYPFSIQCEIESEIEMESCWSNNSKFSNSSFDFLFQIQQDQEDSSGFWNSKLGSFLYKMGGDSKLGGVFCFIFFLLLFLTLLIFVPLFLLFKSKKKKLFQNQSKDFELKKVKNENLQKEFEMDQVVENPLKKKREKMKDLEKNADELLSQIGIEEEEKKRNKKSGLTLKEKMERDFDSIINQK